MLPSQPRSSGGLPGWCPAHGCPRLCACGAETVGLSSRCPSAPDLRPASAPHSQGSWGRSHVCLPFSPFLPTAAPGGASSGPMNPTADLSQPGSVRPGPHASAETALALVLLPVAQPPWVATGAPPSAQSSPPDFPVTPPPAQPPRFSACFPAMLLPLSLATHRRPAIARQSLLSS